MGRTVIDRTGQRFGRLTVLRMLRRDSATFAVCRCDCGREVDVRPAHLADGTTKACGCLRSETVSARQRRHGEGNNGAESPEYRAWRGMMNRCSEKAPPERRRIYYERGITVCQRWRDSFEAFLADVGRKPSPEHTLDRFPDNDGHYEPGNVRWATLSEQARNRRERPRGPRGEFVGGAL